MWIDERRDQLKHPSYQALVEILCPGLTQLERLVDQMAETPDADLATKAGECRRQLQRIDAALRHELGMDDEELHRVPPVPMMVAIREATRMATKR